MKQYKHYLLPFLFLTGFLFRMIFVPNPGFEADMSFWKSWGLAPYDHGLVWSMFHTNNNYPTPFAYLLWFITAIYSVFANPHNYNEFWAHNNVLFLTLMKLPAVLADLGIAGILLYIGKHAKKLELPELPESAYLLTAAIYLFSPISIFDSAVWGQVDSVGVFIFLLSILFAFRKKPFVAGLFYMLALMTKLQNMIYAPLFFLCVWQIGKLSGLMQALAGATLGFFLLNIEFLLTGNMARVITSLTINYDYFPYLSLHAHNIWWMVAKGNGMGISDKILTIGIINAKTMGLILFSSLYLVAVLNQLKNGSKFIFSSLVLVVCAFFFFQTESHDRYLFPAFVFFLFWAPFAIHDRLTMKERKTYWKSSIFQNIVIGYILFSILYFLNLHTAFIANYPKNGIPFLLFLNSSHWTVPLAGILTIFAIGYILISYRYVVISLITIVGACTLLNLPLLLKQPVSLTKLTPIYSKQEYGGLNKNMPVNVRMEDWKTWDRLSSQYFFYSTGLGTHAASTITYPLAKRFTKFATDYGIDTEAGNQASVQFLIYGDETLLFASEVMKRYDNPKHIEVDITGVTNITLVVTDSGNGNYDDHADWLNPTLYP